MTQGGSLVFFIFLGRRAVESFHIPQAPGAKTLFISLRRRALAPLAWLTRLAARRRGRAGRAAARPGPAHLPHLGTAAWGLVHFPQAPGARSALIHIPQTPGARSARLAYAPCGAPARSRRPGRCAARSRSSPTPRVPPGGVLFISLKRRALAPRFFISLRRRALAPLAWLRALRRAGAVAPAGPLRGPVPLTPHTPWAAGWSCSYPSGAWRRAGRAAALPGPAHTPHPVGRRARIPGRFAVGRRSTMVGRADGRRSTEP